MALKSRDMFLNVDLTNMQLFCGRQECNSDRCPSRKCDKYAFSVNCLVSVLPVNKTFSALMFFFHNILNEQHSSAASNGFNCIS